MKRSYAEDMICVEFGDEVLPHRERLILASRRVMQFGKTKFPSRTLGQMSLCGNTSSHNCNVYGKEIFVGFLYGCQLRRIGNKYLFSLVVP